MMVGAVAIFVNEKD